MTETHSAAIWQLQIGSFWDIDQFREVKNAHGVHIIRMRWGMVFDIDANEDSQLVAASLQRWAKYGVNEALADPILS